MKKLSQSTFLREAVSYILVGAVTTIISFAFQFLFPVMFGINYDWSAILAFLFSSPISFFLNRKFTFHAERLPLAKTLTRFYLIVLPCFALSYFVFKPGIETLFDRVALPWPEAYITFARLIAANGIYIVVNYIGQKFFTFKKSAGAPQSEQTENA